MIFLTIEKPVLTIEKKSDFIQISSFLTIEKWILTIEKLLFRVLFKKIGAFGAKCLLTI